MSQGLGSVGWVAERWNPWRALRALDDVDFALVDLPEVLGGGVYIPDDHWAAILIDRSLGRRQRNALLAHELIHHRRGGGTSRQGMPATWEPIARREELIVDREVAQRLVPLEELAGLMAEADDLEVTIEAWQVADHFDVTVEVAELAMRMASPN